MWNSRIMLVIHVIPMHNSRIVHITHVIRRPAYKCNSGHGAVENGLMCSEYASSCRLRY